MRLMIHRENGFWTAHLEELFAEPESYPLIPDTKSLYLLVKAIEATYPQYLVLIDPAISENLFLSKALFNSKYFSSTPDYIRVQYSLDHPEIKKCGLCGGDGWYNCFKNFYWHVGWWECTHCQARQHDDGTWFKLSKFARSF